MYGAYLINDNEIRPIMLIIVICKKKERINTGIVEFSTWNRETSVFKICLKNLYSVYVFIVKKTFYI